MTVSGASSAVGHVGYGQDVFSQQYVLSNFFFFGAHKKKKKKKKNAHCWLLLCGGQHCGFVVEHKPETIGIADHVVDSGLGAGTAGGEVVFQGTVDGLRASSNVTGSHSSDWASLKSSVRRRLV